jgi:hypothetical protein
MADPPKEPAAMMAGLPNQILTNTNEGNET